MSKPVITVENLSKSFTLQHQQPVGGYLALRDVLTDKVKSIFKPGKNRDTTTELFWALKDVSFEVNQGDRIGIIGRNGAGKSTLLKILSRIVAPTQGKITIQGRVASLLEVGTGFHPELTGRENIFLNGAILGMNKAEIKSKFDEIVDFSGVEKFLDTPVKRFSSGMYVRLAFAVAAHLEPEILIIDEVLAVGDAEFQKKCLGKMDDVSKSGRTLLFVSHQMGTISKLCSKSILMVNGNVAKYDSTPLVIDYYLQYSSNQIEKIERQDGFSGNHFRAIQMTDKNLFPKQEYSFEDEISVMVKLSLPDYHPALELVMRLVDKNKNAVFTILEKIDRLISGTKRVDLLVTIPSNFLTPGRYSWMMCINHPMVKLFDLQDDILPFNIVDTGSKFAMYEGDSYGNVFANYSINKI